MGWGACFIALSGDSTWQNEQFVQYHQDTLAAISAKASVENAFFSAISSKPLTSAFAAFQTAANVRYFQSLPSEMLLIWRDKQNFGALLRQLCPDYVTYFDDEKYFLDGPIATVIAAYNGPLDWLMKDELKTCNMRRWGSCSYFGSVLWDNGWVAELCVVVSAEMCSDCIGIFVIERARTIVFVYSFRTILDENDMQCLSFLNYLLTAFGGRMLRSGANSIVWDRSS